MFWIRRYYLTWFVNQHRSNQLFETLKDIPEVVSTPTRVRGHSDTIAVYLKVKHERGLKKVEMFLRRKVEGTYVEREVFRGYVSTDTRIRLINAGKFVVYIYIASFIAATLATAGSWSSIEDFGVRLLYAGGAALATALSTFAAILHKKAESISDLI